MNGYLLGIRRVLADGAKLLNGLGAGPLFASETGDESASSQDSTRLQPAEGPLHITPWQRQMFPEHEVAKHDAPTCNQLFRGGLCEFVRLLDL